MKLPHYFCIIGKWAMLSHFSVTGDAENSAASLISWLSFISESEKRNKEIRVDYEYI